MKPENSLYLGIMASESEREQLPPFGERHFYARLCAEGRRHGLTVFVFSPHWVNVGEGTVRGYSYSGIPAASGQDGDLSSDASGWSHRIYPLPDLIYDRSFFSRRQDYTAHKQAVRRLQSARSIPLLGAGLRSKWHMHALLARDPMLRSYLPETVRLRSSSQVLEQLERSGNAFLKPECGSQGRGVLKAERLEADYRVSFRDSCNRSAVRLFDQTSALSEWLDEFVGRRHYLLQQCLDLHAADGSAWDIRALAQKNGRGLWELAGVAVRMGGKGSITSNIHGGGTAVPALPFLLAQFGQVDAERIYRVVLDLAARIPAALESGNGRMAELGLDLGVDRQGRVWIIEANTKPGRSVFHSLGEAEAAGKAHRNPIAYARYLLTRTTAAAAAPAGAAGASAAWRPGSAVHSPDAPSIPKPLLLFS